MSRRLPPRPNLEHLKNQAKALLPELQRDKPVAKLADAQHALAREYGFASWPKLKVHVESLPRPEEPVAPTVPGSAFVGTWTADVARSKPHPAHLFRSATLHFAVDGDSVTITDLVVDASGREARGENTLRADGRERASEDSDGYALVARWLGSHALETVAKKDGRVVGRGRYEVSADGRTLTVTTEDARANADGWASDLEQMIVLERVASPRQ